MNAEETKELFGIYDELFEVYEKLLNMDCLMQIIYEGVRAESGSDNIMRVIMLLGDFNRQITEEVNLVKGKISKCLTVDEANGEEI